MSHEDKRSSKRISRTFVMRVAVNDGSSWPKWSMVSTRDFSAGGAFFIMDQPVKPGQALLCKIHFGEREIECKATVIRLTPTFQKPLSEAAVSFDWTNEQDRQYVDEFAKKYLEKRP